MKISKIETSKANGIESKFIELSKLATSTGQSTKLHRANALILYTEINWTFWYEQTRFDT